MIREAESQLDRFLTWEAECDRCGVVEESPYIHQPGQVGYQTDFILHILGDGWLHCWRPDGTHGIACPTCARHLAPGA